MKSRRHIIVFLLPLLLLLLLPLSKAEATGTCSGTYAPEIVSGPERVLEKDEARWNLQGGCLDSESWIAPPLEYDGVEKPRGTYFMRQSCQIMGLDTRSPSLRKDTYSSDRFLAFLPGGGIASQTQPDECQFSSEQISRLWAGRHQLTVSLETVYAETLSLGGFVVRSYKSTGLQKAEFEVSAQRDLAISLSPAEGGRVSSPDDKINCGEDCQASYNKGDSVVLQAQAAPVGWIFSSWRSGDKDICSASVQQTVSTFCSLTLLETKNIVANFQKASRKLSLRIAEGGRVVSDPEGISCGAVCEVSFPINSQILLRAEPDPGWRFLGWENCQGSDASCRVDVNRDRVVRASFERMEDPVISGPEVINPDPVRGESAQQWQVRLRGSGPVLCEITEESVYTEEEDIDEDIEGDLRRWQYDCARGAKDGVFQTPLFWEGCPDTEEGGCPDEDSRSALREYSGKIQSLPDGEYTLAVRQMVRDSSGDIVGEASDEKTFFLDRLPPRTIEIELENQEALAAGEEWEFAWGEDLTQTGPLEGLPGRADVRCQLLDEEEGVVASLPEGWGECGYEPEGSFLLPEGLSDGKYYLDIYQRDRVNQIRKTRIPLLVVASTRDSERRGSDLLRFGARWQSIYVSSLRPPAPSEGAIGDAWHPLRCNKSGGGLLELCLSSKDPLDADQDELWERSLPLADRAQGYLRLATPGRFESRRGDRRYAHTRLLLSAREKNQEENFYADFCLPSYNALDPLSSGCLEGFPVSGAQMQLRRTDRGILLPRNPSWQAQNSITGQAEMHVCLPGVPRGLGGSEIADVWDGRDGTLVTNGNRSEVLGVYPDEDCGGYLMYWNWDRPVSNPYTPSARYEGPRQEGGRNICQASAPRESTSEAPRLPQFSEIEKYISSYSYSFADDYLPPYQTSAGQPRWLSRGGQGEPFLQRTAPWISPVACQGGGYLSLAEGSWRVADIEAARGGRLAGLEPRVAPNGGIVPSLAEPGFGFNHFALPPQKDYGDVRVANASDLDGQADNLEEEWIVDFITTPWEGDHSVRWFMDSRYYGYHLQRWAFQTDVNSEKRWIEVFAPRSSR